MAHGRDAHHPACRPVEIVLVAGGATYSPLSPGPVGVSFAGMQAVHVAKEALEGRGEQHFPTGRLCARFRGMRSGSGRPRLIALVKSFPDG